MEDEIKKEDFTEMLKENSEEINKKLDEKFKDFDETATKVNTLFEVKASEKEEDKFNKGGFTDLGDFAKAIHSSKNVLDDKLKTWIGVAEKTLNEGVQSDGGFTVPPEFYQWEFKLCNCEICLCRY